MIRKDNKYMHPEIHKYWKSLGGAIEFWSNQDDGEIFFSIYFPEIKHHYSDVCIIQKDGTPGLPALLRTLQNHAGNSS